MSRKIVEFVDSGSIPMIALYNEHGISDEDVRDYLLNRYPFYNKNIVIMTKEQYDTLQT